jgi:hypothetical protein
MSDFNHGFVLSLTDRYVKEMRLREEDPGIFGSVSAEPMEFPAASFQTIEQTFTVGTRDLEPGAYIMVAQLFAATQGKYQTDNQKADNYVTVRCSNESAEFEATTKRKFGMHGGFRFPAPNIAFELVKGRLTKGDTVTIVYGDKSGGSRGFKVHAISNDAYQLPLYISFGDEDRRWGDALLDISYDYELDMIPFRVIGVEAWGVHGFAPSIARAGDPFEISVRTEDKFFNLAEGEIPAYEVFLNGESFGKIDAGDDAITIIDNIKIDEPGIYRFTFHSANGEIAGYSNPILVQENPTSGIYWGETHGHCGFAEGQGSPEGYFRFGRDEARLDFLTLSEHDLWTDAGEWEILKDNVRKFHKERSFITYAGYEWTAQGPLGGHHNVLFRNPDRAQRAPNQEYPFLRDLYEALREKNDVNDVLIIPHCHEAGDWRMNDAEMETLVEIFSEHGSFEWFGRMYLQQGYKIGFIAASDDHMGHPGYSTPRMRGLAQRGGLAAVIAPERTTDAIFDAMKNLSAYATTGERIILDVAVNDSPMGTTTPPSDKVTVKGKVHGTAPIDSITIVKNDDTVWSRDYRTVDAIAESGSTFIEVIFFSASTTPDDRFDNPRGWRLWKGTMEVEGAKNVSLDATYHNALLSPTGQDPQNPNLINFDLQTRGDEYRILLELEDVSPETRIKIALEESVEFPTAPSRLRPPVTIPATEFSLAFKDIKDGKLAHELPVDIYTDTVSLRLVDSAAPLDRSFEFIDESTPQEGDYYYARVKQADSSAAWSSPVWIGSATK